jgi:hypothetical protein
MREVENANVKGTKEMSDEADLKRDDEVELWLFHGECGHQWVGASCGSYQCPVCGLWDGDHHLTSTDPIPVQVNDWGGGVWKALAEASDKAWAQRSE